MKTKFILLRITSVILIAFVFHTAYSQSSFKPGYVIMQSGDTLPGFIESRNWSSNPSKISFKENLNGENIWYEPLDIKGFSVRDERYESAIIQTEISPSGMQELELGSELNLVVDTAFLQAMITGTKSLYFYINKHGNNQFYIKTDSAFEFLTYKKYLIWVDSENKATFQSETKVIESQIFLGQLMLYLEDCPNIKPKIENTKYTIRSMLSLFDFYYDCTESKAEYQKTTEKVKTEFGLVAGLALTKVEANGDAYTYLVDADFQQSINPAAGISFNVIIPRTKGKWSLYNELAFSSYKIDGHHLNFFNENKYTVTNTTLGYYYLKMINMARFSFPIHDFNVFLNLGISNGYGFNETNELHQEITIYSSFDIKEGKALDETRKIEYGYIAGAGAQYKRYSVEYRYEIGNGMSEYLRLGVKTKKSFFLLGYKF